MGISSAKNRVGMSVTGTPGTGTITLNTAEAGYQSFATAYGANANVDILLEDGNNWEVARDCTYTHSGTTVTRGTFEASSSGSAINLTSSAKVYVINSAERINRSSNLLEFLAVGSGSNQTLSSTSTFIQVTCMTESYDRNGVFNNTTKVAVLPAGRWLIFAAGNATCNDGKRMIIRLGVDTAGGTSLSSSNSQSRDFFRGFSSAASGFVGGTGTCEFTADGTASIGLLVWQDSDTSSVVTATDYLVSFGAIYLGGV